MSFASLSCALASMALHDTSLSPCVLSCSLFCSSLSHAQQRAASFLLVLLIDVRRHGAAAMAALAVSSRVSLRAELPTSRAAASRAPRTLALVMMCAPSESELPNPEAPSSRVPSRIGGTQGDWRVERARLQQWHSEGIRRRKPKFASFGQTSIMVQALGLTTEAEWINFMEMGEFQSPYVPRDPESYYGPRGQWLGWRCWLTGEMGGDEGTQDA